MADLSYSTLPVSGQTNNASDVTTPLNEVKSYINGSLTNSNLSGSAGITDANLASPTGSVHRTLFTSKTVIGAAITNAGTYLLGSGIYNSGRSVITPYNAGYSPTLASIDSALYNVDTYYFASADHSVAGKTQKLRVRAFIATNATAMSSTTITVGLYPLTSSGGSGVLTLSAGTVVSGSTTALTTPAASSTTQNNSGDFTIPSDGLYALGFTVSASPSANSAALIGACLQSVYV